MLKREEKRVIPDSRRIIDIDVTDKGSHYFKLPRMLKATRILKKVDLKKLGMDASEMTSLEYYEHLGESAEMMVELISACWFHEELDFTGDDPKDRLEELFDADYDEWEISQIFYKLYTAVVESLAPVAQAREEAPDFLEQPGDSEK